jgi:hypothetical protein
MARTRRWLSARASRTAGSGRASDWRRSRLETLHVLDAVVDLLEQRLLVLEGGRELAGALVQLVGGPSQRLLGPLALRDVVHHSRGLDDPSALVPEVLALLVDEADLSSGPLDHPMLDLVGVAPLPDRAEVGGVDCGAVVGWTASRNAA